MVEEFDNMNKTLNWVGQIQNISQKNVKSLLRMVSISVIASLNLDNPKRFHRYIKSKLRENIVVPKRR